MIKAFLRSAFVAREPNEAPDQWIFMQEEITWRGSLFYILFCSIISITCANSRLEVYFPQHIHKPSLQTRIENVSAGSMMILMLALTRTKWSTRWPELRISRTNRTTCFRLPIISTKSAVLFWYKSPRNFGLRSTIFRPRICTIRLACPRLAGFSVDLSGFLP